MTDQPEGQPAALPEEPPQERPPDVELRDGVPPLTNTPDGLASACAALRAGSGPVAVDAERASGFRYGQRAYLLQFNREGSGSWIIDPVAFTDLTELQTSLSGVEWVLHAASQDLPCLRDIGLVPDRIFDTELAARLLGRDRVGLGPLVESELRLYLAKGHGAADWSTRPLPEDWMRYAALDVEVLIELRDLLAAELQASGKAEWAAEEFEAVRTSPPASPRQDPWRRTSGLHRVRTRRALAVVQALWEARDDIAQQRDMSPGRILPDTAIVAVALALPGTSADMLALPEFSRAHAQRYARRWWAAVEQAMQVPEADLPAHTLSGDGPPPPRVWAERDPDAAARLTNARACLSGIAETINMPIENLLTPDTLRRLAWRPPETISDETVADALRHAGARSWQVAQITPRLTIALRSTAQES